MPGAQRKSEWLVRWRARRQSKRHRTVMEKLFGTVEEDSDEKIASITPTEAGNLMPRTAGTTPKAAGAAAFSDRLRDRSVATSRRLSFIAVARLVCPRCATVGEGSIDAERLTQ